MTTMEEDNILKSTSFHVGLSRNDNNYIKLQWFTQKKKHFKQRQTIIFKAQHLIK